MSACESCDHRFTDGETAHFAADDPEPGCGVWMCDDCWVTAQCELSMPSAYRGRAIEYLYYNHGFSSTATDRHSNETIRTLIEKYHPGGYVAFVAKCDAHHTTP